MSKKNIAYSFIVVLIIIFIWSAIRPHDYFTWMLEVMPAVLGAIVLLITYKRFKFTSLVYILMWFHAIILIVGGKYTYELNPLFEWLKELFGWSRNYYDRLGHFFQGFVPALIAREVLIRVAKVRRGGWLIFIVISICLAISALYELIEWWVAAGMGKSADAFLGSQGDIWDAQKDMFLALIGSVVGLLVFSRLHNKQLDKIKGNGS